MARNFSGLERDKKPDGRKADFRLEQADTLAIEFGGAVAARVARWPAKSWRPPSLYTFRNIPRS